MWPHKMAARLFSLAVITAVLLISAAASAQNGGVSGWELNYASDVAAQILKPSVVFIETRFDRPRNDTEYAIWSYFRGARPLYGLYGSGFIYKDPKYVITTPFLLTHAEHIRVITSDGRAFPAEVVDEDDVFKTAVLEVDWGYHYEPVPALLASSEDLKLGEPITILGYDTEGVDYVSTVGVISAIRKEMPSVEEPTEQYIQFDAAYELPMMGGPLANVKGEVVGIVYGTVQDFYQSNINLAVPINDLVRVADRIISGEAKQPWFGLETLWLTDQIRLLNKVPDRIENGVFITYVEPGSPADLAGLLPGDVVIAMDGIVFAYYFDYKAFMRRVDIGQIARVTYWRYTANITEAAGTTDQDLYETVVQILEYPEEDEDEEEGMPPHHGH